MTDYLNFFTPLVSEFAGTFYIWMIISIILLLVGCTIAKFSNRITIMIVSVYCLIMAPFGIIVLILPTYIIGILAGVGLTRLLGR